MMRTSLLWIETKARLNFRNSHAAAISSKCHLHKQAQHKALQFQTWSLPALILHRSILQQVRKKGLPQMQSAEFWLAPL